MQKSLSQMNLIQDMPVSLKTPISILRANMTDMNMHVDCPETTLLKEEYSELLFTVHSR